jgi:hypothetical protein
MPIRRQHKTVDLFQYIDVVCPRERFLNFDSRIFLLFLQASKQKSKVIHIKIEGGKGPVIYRDCPVTLKLSCRKTEGLDVLVHSQTEAGSSSYRFA